MRNMTEDSAVSIVAMVREEKIINPIPDTHFILGC